MRITFLDAKTIGDVPNLKRFKEFGEFIVFQTTKKNERINHIKNSEIIITNKVIIDKEVIDNCNNLKLICVAATGKNNVDLDYAKIKGLQVKNVVDYSTESVAQYTFALVLSLINRVNYYNNYVISGEYSKSDIFTHIGESFWQISGKRFGIIGLGNIGKKVARIAVAFEAEVIYYSTTGKNYDKIFKRVSFEELLSTSNIITIHAPLNENTKNLISLKEMKQMNPETYLINMARGGIINEADLSKAINDNIIAGAATDVLTNEPIKGDNPLFKIKNKEKIIITPHIAWASIESRTL